MLQSGRHRQPITILLKSASRAPSVHNSQPWVVRVTAPERLEVLLNENIALLYADPTGRGGWMAIGAFVENLAVIAEKTGMRASIEFLNNVVTTELEPAEPTDRSTALGGAMGRRATNRSLFTPLQDVKESTERLGIFKEGGSAAVFIQDSTRLQKLAELNREGTRAAYKDRGFCGEHADWLRSSFTRKKDGIPGYAIGVPALVSLMLPHIIRTKDISAKRADAEYKKSLSTNLYAVITAGTESPEGWFNAGRCMQRLMLRATELGIEQSPNAAPIEMGFADEVRSLAGTPDHPQLLIRLGRAEPVRRHTPRKPVEEFTTWERSSDA